MNFVQNEQRIQLLRDLVTKLAALHKDLDELQKSVMRLAFSIERDANSKEN